MKKLFYLLLVTSLIFTACKKNKDEENEKQLEPKQTQRGFAINYTAVWCGPCGSWGAPLIHDFADEAPDGAVICAHANSDPMHNQVYNSFRADRTTGGGIPSFWVGDVKTTSSNAMTTLLNQSAICGVDYKYEVKDGKMYVDTKVKFFDADQGTYYMSVLVLEDGIPGGTSASSDYQQNGTSNPDYTHDFVLRASAHSNNAYGDILVENPTDGKVIEESYTIDLESSWDDVYPVCIIWKFESGGQNPHYKYINSLKKK